MQKRRTHRAALFFVLLGAPKEVVEPLDFAAENVIETKPPKFVIPQVNRYFCALKQKDLNA